VPGYVHNALHIATHSGIMHRHDDPGARRDGGFDEVFVNIHGVGADVNKDRQGAAQHKGVDGGDEGEAGHDELVAGLQVAEQGRHFQGGGAGMGEQRFFGAAVLLQPGIAFARELAVAGEMPFFHRLGYVVKLLAGYVRLVEGDVCHGGKKGAREILKQRKDAKRHKSFLWVIVHVQKYFDA